MLESCGLKQANQSRRCSHTSTELDEGVGKIEIELCTLVTVLDLGLISIASLGPRASTKAESHVNFNKSRKV